MQLLFIADLHLSEDTPHITEKFLAWLKKLCNAQAQQPIQGLYILGDLFAAWIGDDNLNSLNQAIIAALKSVTDHGIPLFIMPGNRDVLLDERFCKLVNAKLLKDPSVINIHHVALLLTHGDMLCTRDIKHQIFRKIIRNPLIKKFFLWLPLTWRRQIAKKMSRASNYFKSKMPLEIMDVTQAKVEQIMRERQVNYLIHGHTHHGRIHQFMINDHPMTRAVLHDWNEMGNVLVVKYHNHAIELDLQLF